MKCQRRFWLTVSLLSLFSASAVAVDPTCDTTWTKTSNSWTCDGNGKISFNANTSFVPAANLTLIADNGFVLSGNTVGSATVRVTMRSTYGDYTVNNSTIFGNVSASSGVFNVTGSSVNGTINTAGNITLSNTTVTGLVTSSSNTVTLSNSTLQAGITSHSGITASGGTINGAISMTALNIIRLTGVTMPTGSISGASSVYLDNSDLGTASGNVNVTTGSNDIYVQGGSIIYGNLSAAVNFNGTVQVQNGSVYGNCLPKSDPINACNATPPASVHHYEFAYSSPGITCEAETVTIKACTNAACSTLYTGATAITLAATNSGSWSNASPTFSAGSASSALRKTSTGSSVLSLASASPVASNALVCKNAGATDSSCSINFADAALKISATDGISAVPDLVAGQNYTVKLRAIETNNNTGACQARVQGNKTVGVAFRCLNPSSCISGQTVRHGLIGISGTSQSSNPSYTNVPLTFDNTGTASVSFNYTDVGQIALHAQLVLVASGNDPGITLTAPAAITIVKPYEIRVSAVTSANGSIANQKTTNSGSGFVAAGTPFRVQLDVLNASNALTPNFGRESSPETLRVGFVGLVYPAGGTGNAAYLSNNGSFSAVSGTAGRFQNAQLSWLEAGSFTLQGLLTDGNYLGAGDVSVKPTSDTIGRFYPQEFVLSNVSTSHICTAGSPAFSYMGQPGVPLSFELQAVNTAGTRLLNYHSASYTNTADIGLVAENNGSSHTPNLTIRLSGLPSVTWQQGRYLFTASTLQLTRGSAVDGPFLNFQPGITVVSERDSRNLQSTVLTMNAATSGTCAGTACNAAPLGNALKFYYGRYRLENAYGSASQAAPVQLKAEVWNGSQFVLQNADSCSAVNSTLLSATGTPTLSISVTNTVLGSGVNPNNSLLLAAPGQNGSWSLQYQAPVWLKYNWNPAVAGDENPTATALFGRYRGNDRLIYQREQ